MLQAVGVDAPAGNCLDIPTTQDVHLGGQLLGLSHVPKLAQVITAPSVALRIRADSGGMAIPKTQRRPMPHNLQMVTNTDTSQLPIILRLVLR